jgi:hypothetical protein
MRVTNNLCLDDSLVLSGSGLVLVEPPLRSSEPQKVFSLDRFFTCSLARPVSQSQSDAVSHKHLAAFAVAVGTIPPVRVME